MAEVFFRGPCWLVQKLAASPAPVGRPRGAAEAGQGLGGGTAEAAAQRAVLPSRSGYSLPIGCLFASAASVAASLLAGLPAAHAATEAAVGAVAASAATKGGAASAAASFWGSWGDGTAEISGYRLRMPRYGQPRDGSLVLIYVTEDFSDSLRVKADPGRHPPSDVYPVLKLNAIRKFQTGIYDYSVIVSVFSRVDFAAGERPFPLRKLSFSSQEWCGHVFHQIIPDAGAASRPGGPPARWQSTSHSYFDGEADEQRVLSPPPAAGVVVAEDELPILLRSYIERRDFLAAGEQRTVAFLPSLLRARLQHKPLSFTDAVITRTREPRSEKTPAGEVSTITYSIRIGNGAADGDGAIFQFEAAPPHRLVHYRWDSGEEATLLGSTRLPYWQLHDNGHEILLQKLGLGGAKN